MEAGKLEGEKVVVKYSYDGLEEANSSIGKSVDELNDYEELEDNSVQVKLDNNSNNNSEETTNNIVQKDNYFLLLNCLDGNR